MFFKIILFIFLLFISVFIIFTITYWDVLRTSDYGLCTINGVMGSGKSTLLTRYMVEYKLKDWHIFANFDMPFASPIDPKHLADYSYPEDSLLLIDEASTIWQNRQYKKMPLETINWLKDVRKMRLKVVMVSQNNDLDKVIRNLAHETWILKRIWLFSIAKRVGQTMDIAQQKDEKGNSTAEGDIIFKYFYQPITSWKITFIPRYMDLFDSFKRITDLPDMEYTPILEDEKKLTDKWYRKHRSLYWRRRWYKLVYGFFTKAVSIVKSFKNFTRSKRT